VRLLAIVLVLVLILSSCGGGSSSNPAGALSGNWQMTMQPVRTRVPVSQSGFLVQQKSSLTGSMIATDACAGASPVTGTLSGSTVNLTVNQFGAALTMTGTVSADNASMGGSYSISEGSCRTADTGTWTASLVKPVQGSFHGTITSNVPPLLGNTYQVTGSLTQGANTGSSNTDLTGVITAVNYPCFSTANVRGTISGQNVLLTFFDPATGNKVGSVPGLLQSFATLSLDATTLSDTSASGYAVNGCPGLGTLGTGGDGGQIALTFP
jgi:hypothetical protein